MQWREIPNFGFPWVDMLNQVMPSEVDGQPIGRTLYVTSDYSGEHSESPYDVYSFLAIDVDRSSTWPVLIAAVREEYFPGGRRMAYKRLGDGVRKRALPYFLNAASAISGICVSFVIDKRSLRFFDREFRPPNLHEIMGVSKEWKPVDIHKAIRIGHFGSLIIAGLAGDNREVIWITDEDSVVANESRLKEFAGICSKFLTAHAQYPLESLKFGTTAIDPGDLGEEDLAAIPDLIAGTLSETVRLGSQGASWPDLDRENPIVPADKVLEICGWIEDDTKLLKTVSFVIEQSEAGSTHWFRLGLQGEY